jgi:hypothetical protein
LSEAIEGKRVIMRRVNPELWLLLFLVVIAAGLNFLVASQPMTLMFYFLPTLYSAYRFGRRHATLTACASIVLVVLLTYLNPTVFVRPVSLPIDARWFDVTLWGGILVVSSYAMGTLYERNAKTLLEMKEGYEGILLILRQFLNSQTYSESRPFRISVYASQIAKALGLDEDSTEDLRTAALLQNLNEIGISNEMLYKAANLTQEGVEKGARKRQKVTARSMGGSLQRAIPILVAGQKLIKTGEPAADAPVEVQILVMAENYELLVNGPGRKLSSEAAQESILRSSREKFDSMILDAFGRAFEARAKAATV